MKAVKKDTTTSIFSKSEFWITAITSIAGLLMAFGIITPEQNNSVTQYVPNIIGALMSLLSSSKFVATQHNAKVEVFRAMCALQLSGKGGEVTAQGVGGPENTTLALAKAAGL